MRRYNAVDKFYQLHRLIARAEKSSKSIENPQKQNIVELAKARYPFPKLVLEEYNFGQNNELKNLQEEQDRAA